MAKGQSAEKAIKDIRCKTRRQFSAEEKIRIVMEGMRGEESISASTNARRTCAQQPCKTMLYIPRGMLKSWSA